MNGSPTGLESADSGSAIDAEERALAERREQYSASFKTETEIVALRDWFLQEGEWKAAREVDDALQRWKAREGQRRSEGVHGEDPAKTKVVVAANQYVSFDGRLIDLD